MANKEQLERLLAGVEGWNKWRMENPHAKIDLREANLKGSNLLGVVLRAADLFGVNLWEANLGEANLIGARLGEADLREANLGGADLRKAILFRADLNGADLSRSNLSEADLSGTDLIGVDFNSADLSEADLSGAFLSGALLGGANFTGAFFENTTLGIIDFSKTKGLDEIKHLGPSPISTRTLELFKGKIPEQFLRGCGLSDWEIEAAKLYQPGLSADQVTSITDNVCQFRAGNSIQYYSCFISYSSKDEEFAKRLHNDLQNKGVRCWFAPEDLKIGDKFRGRIDDAIRVHDKLLIVLSEYSINSTWVEKEVETAFEKEHKIGITVLFPIRLDDGVIKTDQAWAADIRRTRHIGDFSNWKDKGS